LKLGCPSAARVAISPAVLSSTPAGTGCRNQSAAASALAPAISRAIAAVIDSPDIAKVMFPMVVMPPAKAASDPVQKSSTHIGPRCPPTASASAAHTR